jgi:hypothetical protein
MVILRDSGDAAAEADRLVSLPGREHGLSRVDRYLAAGFMGGIVVPF